MPTGPLAHDPEAITLADVLRRTTAAAGLVARTLRHVDDVVISAAKAVVIDGAVGSVLAALEGAGPDLELLAGIDGDELVVTVNARLSDAATSGNALNGRLPAGVAMAWQTQGQHLTIWLTCPMAGEWADAGTPVAPLAIVRDPKRVSHIVGRVVTVWQAGRRRDQGTIDNRSAA